MKEKLMKELTEIALNYASIVRELIPKPNGTDLEDTDLDEISDAVSSLAELARAINDFGGVGK